MFRKIIAGINRVSFIEELLEKGDISKIVKIFLSIEDSKIRESLRKAIVEVIITRHDLISSHKEKVMALLLAINTHGFNTIRQYRDYLSPKTASVTLLAGSGTRWIQSIVEVINTLIGNASNSDENYNGSYYDDEISSLLQWVPSGKTGKTDVDDLILPAWVSGKKQEHPLPRGLFPVDNLFGTGPEKISIADFGIDALQRLSVGRFLITDGQNNNAIAEALEPIGVTNPRFVTQDWSSVTGKPLGHGDAMAQLFEKAHPENEYEYAIVNFAGNSNSESTALAGLMLLDVLACIGEDIFEVLPITFKPESPYPIVFTEGKNRGRVVTAFHPKLMGVDTKSQEFVELIGNAATNIGIRIVRLSQYRTAVASCVETFNATTGQYNIPLGNNANSYKFVHPEKGDRGEFAMDHLEIRHPENLATICIGDPSQIAEVKEIANVPGFLDDEEVVQRNQSWLGNNLDTDVSSMTF